ncbi:MAG: hypothetical protein ACRDJO_12425 [Actinomycetota bacterium]
MRRLAASLASLAIAGTGLVATAAPAVAGTSAITDPVGDVLGDPAGQDARADITHVSAQYQAGTLSLSMKVASPEDPSTGQNWIDFLTTAIWELDVDADGSAEYGVVYLNVDGGLHVGVLRPDDSLACEGTPGFDGTSYTASLPASCIGAPASLRVNGLMGYETETSMFVDSTAAFTVDSGMPIVPGPKAAVTILGMVPTPSGNGYWMAGPNGTVLNFGDAKDLGSMVGTALARPIVGMEATPSGNGYWLVASDGGIFAYGDARFFGSTGNIALVKPIVGMTSTPTGNGYWMVASDGGIFAYGDAPFFGSTGNLRLAQPIVGMSVSGTGKGYWMVTGDGSVFAFGDAPFKGSAQG